VARNKAIKNKYKKEENASMDKFDLWRIDLMHALDRKGMRTKGYNRIEDMDQQILISHGYQVHVTDRSLQMSRGQQTFPSVGSVDDLISQYRNDLSARGIRSRNNRK